MTLKLAVPYLNQLDNDTGYFGTGSRQCNLTSNAMAANFILADRKLESLSQRAKRLGLTEPESAYGKILNKYGDTTDHKANTQALAELGLKSYFSTNLNIEDAIDSLDKRIPMPVGVHYKLDGHILCLVGYDLKKKIFWAHDPYGIRAGIADYYEAVGGQSGKYDKYSFEIMQKLWASQSDGWGRVFTEVGGKLTGL
jgi:Peptidase_C39 like family